MRVAVLFNDDEQLAHGATNDAAAVVAVQSCAHAIASALERLGHAASLLAAPERPRELLAALERARPDVVFNLVESLRGDARLEAAAIALLELTGIPFTGSRSLACALALRKPLAKALLASAGVPVARGIVVEPQSADAASREARRAREERRSTAQLREWAGAVPFPWIVKPSREDASHGIARESVVATLDAAWERVEFVLDHYRQPALVEEFVGGRELNVALLETTGRDVDAVRASDGLEVLPLAEIDFSRFAPGRPRLVTFAGKWIEGSEDWNATVVKDAELPRAVAEEVAAVARASFQALRLSGYGRVDLRLTDALQPVVLELNPNPDLSPDAGFARAWSRTGRTYDELVARVLALAREGPAA